jgi:PAS domain S-box-containing protein
MKQSVTVLVVEDDEGLNVLIQKILKKEGFLVDSALNGNDAILKATENKEILMLLDYKLPDMNGREVIESLIRKKCNVPFIIITGHGDERIAVELMKLGARDYIIKSAGLREILPHVVARTVNDIVQRKKLLHTEKALSESEKKLRAIYDNAIDGILVADQESKRFVTGNLTIGRMLGYSMNEIQKMGVNDIHPEEDLPNVIEQFEKVVRKEITLVSDIPVKRKDGTIFYADIHASSAVLGGKSCLIGMFRDITERRLAREELKKRVIELEEFYEMAVGRELKMKELKEEIERFRFETAELKKKKRRD